MPDRWQESDVPRGAAYDRRFEDLAAPAWTCTARRRWSIRTGPGRCSMRAAAPAGWPSSSAGAAIAVVGVDVDEAMLEAARAKAPDLAWVRGDLADPGLDFGRTFDVVVMAGNVLIFVPPGTEERVIANAARWLAPGGLLVTGYSLQPDGFGPRRHDALAARSGLVLQDRWSTWDRRPFSPRDRYAVAVHRREA